jgi:D-alanine-D-alanine ligase
MARVLLVFGGRSAEHEVSCVSAVAVHGALQSRGHDVIPVGIDREGNWHASEGGRPMRAEGRLAEFRLPDGRLTVGRDEVSFDVVFPVLHGPFGEDGTIQGVFEMAGVPYVGCGVLASAVAMDKDIAKRLVAEVGIPVVPWALVRSDEFTDNAADQIERIVKEIGVPAFVKPANLGSSVGVTLVESEAELKGSILAALRYDDKVLVEPAIRGREIEVAVLEGPEVSVAGEIFVTSGFYDYDAKYNDPTSRFEAPAVLTEPEMDLVRTYAAEAFTALGCTGLARVDFFFEERGRGFLLNEVNTMPGFTPISGFPKMWEASGVSYPELCDFLVDLALQRSQG